MAAGDLVLAKMDIAWKVHIASTRFEVTDSTLRDSDKNVLNLVITTERFALKVIGI